MTDGADARHGEAQVLTYPLYTKMQGITSAISRTLRVVIEYEGSVLDFTTHKLLYTYETRVEIDNLRAAIQ